MERAMNSSSACCSCSGRAGQHLLQVHCHTRGLHRCHLPTAELKQLDKRTSDHNGAWRDVRARGQAPRQPSRKPDDDGDGQLPPAQGPIIAALVAAGLSGTCAVVGAGFARIDLFGQFRWGATDDLLLALALSSGIMVVEAVLFLPRYDRLLADAGRPGAKPGAVGLQLRTNDVGALLSADSVAAALVLQQACFVAAQVVRSRGSIPIPQQQAPGPDGQQPQPDAGQQQQASAAALVEVGLVLVRETAKELLQRGLLFTFLALWLTDRAFEAGAEDTLRLPLAALAAAPSTPAAAAVVEVYLTDAVRYATAALLTALMVPPVLNEAEALRLGVASNLALVTVQQQQEAEREKQLAAEAVMAAAVTAVTAAAAEGEAYDEGRDQRETDAMLREYRLIEALGRSTSTGPPRLTYAVTLFRGLLRFGSVNMVFALTGNLAATLLASALPNLLLLGYVRSGPMVLLERPAPEQRPDVPAEAKEVDE